MNPDGSLIKADTNGPSHGILGNDRQIPKDQKLVVTDIALENWIAAHYGISLDNIPYRTDKIPKSILKRMKKTYNDKLQNFDFINKKGFNY